MTYDQQRSLSAKPIALVGSGTMGRAIALTLATRGGVVRLYDTRPEVARSAAEFVASRIGDLIERHGGASQGFTPAVVETADTLEAAVAGAGFILEAAPENAELKRELLGRLDELAGPTAIIATNSSSFPAFTLLDRVKNPGRVLNVHFMMPPDVPGVDLMSTGETSDEIITFLLDELSTYVLRPVRLAVHSLGFPGNRLLEALIREALQIVEDGASTPEQVDAIWCTASGMPFGPFALMDTIGLDVCSDIEEHRRQLQPVLNNWKAVEILARPISEGRLGLKTGRGFFDYTGGPPSS